MRKKKEVLEINHVTRKKVWIKNLNRKDKINWIHWPPKKDKWRSINVFLYFSLKCNQKLCKHFNAKFLQGIPVKVKTFPFFLLTESIGREVSFCDCLRDLDNHVTNIHWKTITVFFNSNNSFENLKWSVLTFTSRINTANWNRRS